MKYLITLALAFIFLTGCSKKSEQAPVNDAAKYQVDSSDIKAAPIENPNESFKLAYKLAKDKTYHYRLSTITSDLQTIKTNDTTLTSKVTQTIIYLIDLTPVSVDKDGIMEINCMFNSVKLNADANGREFNYESGVNKDSVEKNKYADYEALTNSDIGLRVSKRGEILEVFRTDKIVNKFLSLKGLTDSVNAAEIAQLKTNMVEGAVKPLLYQIFRSLPDHQLAKDSGWTYQQPASQFMVFQMQNTNTYKVSELEKFGNDKLAVIEGGLMTAISGKNKVSQQGVDYDFKKPETTAGGKIFFNITEGCIQKAKTFTKINISFSMRAKTPKGIQRGSKSETITNSYVLERL